MSDISRKEAIIILEMLKDAELIEDRLVIGTWYARLGKKIKDAVRMAINSLEVDETYQLEYERVTGHWIDVDANLYACSKCSNGLRIDPMDNSITQMKYCPFCRAKMEVDDV